MPKDDFQVAVVASDSTGQHTPGDVTLWRDGNEVTVAPHELRLAYELALRTKGSRDRLLGPDAPVTDEPLAPSEWKVGDQCEVGLHSRRSWVRGVVADRAIGEYRVVDPAEDRRWGTWVKPWEMYPVTEKDALRAERDALKRRLETTPPWPEDWKTLDDDQLRALMQRWSAGPEAYQADADALIATVIAWRSTAKAMEGARDSAWIERDEERNSRILAEEGREHLRVESLRLADERDRLRRGLEGLREKFISDIAKRPWSAKDVDHLRGWVREQLDTILAGPTTQPPSPPPPDPKLEERARALYVHCTGDRHNLHTLGWHELPEERKGVWRSKVRGGKS